MRHRRRTPLFKVGDYVMHKNDPDVHGTVVEVTKDGDKFVLQAADGNNTKPIGYWLLKRTNILEAIARSAARNFRGPGA